MTELPWMRDEALRRELAAQSTTRLKLKIGAGALIAIVSASHVIEGAMHGTISAKGLSLFGLALGLYVAAHYSLLLIARRALRA